MDDVVKGPVAYYRQQQVNLQQLLLSHPSVSGQGHMGVPPPGICFSMCMRCCSHHISLSLMLLLLLSRDDRALIPLTAPFAFADRGHIDITLRDIGMYRRHDQVRGGGGVSGWVEGGGQVLLRDGAPVAGGGEWGGVFAVSLCVGTLSGQGSQAAGNRAQCKVLGWGRGDDEQCVC